MGSPTPTAICSAKTNAAILLASSAFVRANSSAWTLADTTPVTSSGRSGHLRGILVKIPAPPDICRVQQEDRLRANGAEDYPEVPATPPRRRICSHSTLERKKTLNSELTDHRDYRD